MRERRLTFRALAALTQVHDADGRGVTYAYLCGLTSGREQPQPPLDRADRRQPRAA
jgi:hypothetical protein